jgi:CelD/BcsL family acetyltransferase involved in cellulose biosynthesis
VGDTTVIALDDARWAAFVAERPDATAFHRPGWARTLATAYGFETFVAASFDGGQIVAGMPLVALGRRRGRRWVSLPFTDLCLPLGEPSAVEALVHDVERLRLADGIDSVEIRGPLECGVGSPVTSGLVHVLELASDPADVRARNRASQAWRNVDRAAREGVEVSFHADSEALVDTYYRLHLETRRRQGVPVQPRRFFARLWEHVVGPGHGFVLVARVESRPAAAAVFLDGNDALTYKFGASDPETLGKRPNHAIFWAAIEWACRAGRRALDMGRTDEENAGLRAFKSSWGAVERPLVYTHLGRQHAAARGRAGLLRPLIAHSPLVVCRVLGEAFYRRAA